MGNQRVRYVVTIAILVALYFTTARLGLGLNAVSGFATLIWPPTGIALAAMLILGYRYWPGIALAAFLVNLVTGAAPLVALGIATGNTLEALAGAFLLQRFARFQPSLERVQDVLGLIFFAAIFSTLVSATVGVSTLLLGGNVHSATYATTWLTWWVGDMLGDLVVAPFLLVWWRLPRFSLNPRVVGEATALFMVLVAVSGLVFHGLPGVEAGTFTLGYFIFPILLWIVFRFGQRGSVTAVLVVSFIAVGSTIIGSRPPADDLSRKLLLLQSFVGVTAVTFMVMAAVVAERAQSQKRRLQLTHRTELLTKQRSRLMALNKSKDEFISLASHQLRTPATAVKQYIGMMLENYTGRLTKAQREMLLIAYQNNERQIQVSNELLNVAYIDSGNVELNKQKVDLTALINEVIQAQASAFAERNQKINLHSDNRKYTAYIDKAKFGMALENVIGNAGKYSLPGKKIEVQLAKKSDNFLISVQDEGIGIAKKDLGKVFKKFARIDNSLSVGGIGLGLYWAKKVIDLHGGSIRVLSRPNQGSTFTITLPAGRK